jgi:hypothetical protein
MAQNAIRELNLRWNGDSFVALVRKMRKVLKFINKQV